MRFERWVYLVVIPLVIGFVPGYQMDMDVGYRLTSHLSILHDQLHPCSLLISPSSVQVVYIRDTRVLDGWIGRTGRGGVLTCREMVRAFAL